MYHNGSTYWQYKVCGDIRGGSLELNDSGVVENIDFQSFRMPHLRTLKK